MNNSEEKEKTTLLMYGWYFKGSPEEVTEKGEKSESQGMFPHYRIEVKTNIGPDIRMGVLSGYNAGTKEWSQLNSRNIHDDSLYKSRQEGLGRNHYIFIQGFGLWKVDGLVVDDDSAILQITKFRNIA